MKQNSNNIRNWRGSTFQLVLERLLIVPLFWYYYTITSLSKPSSLTSFQHYQRDIVRGVEGYIVTGSKQVEIGELPKTSFHLWDVISYKFLSLKLINFFLFLTGTKLSEDSRKYGTENTCTSGNTLSKAAQSFGRARAQMEKEHGILLKALGTQVCKSS